MYEKYGKDPYLSLYLYGIYDESVPNILSRLSLPLITCLYALESILKLFMDKKKSAFICTCIACLFGYFFVFKTNLIRYCLYHFFHIFIEDPLECFGVSGICFLILLPTSYLDFVLIFSLGFQLISKCCSSSFKRKCASYVFIWGIQFIYFHEVDYIFLCLFSLLRKWNALLFILSFFQIHPFFTIPSLSFHYVPSILFISLFFYCMYCIFQKKKSICLLILFCLPYIETNLNPFFHVYVLDIGQGDCTLIVEPFKRSVVMIDCGQNLYRDNVESIVLPVLEDLQIHSIDYCIVTHSDFDHSGGVEELDEKFDIKHIVTSSKEDINVSYPFYSLLEDRDYDNENDMSIISYFSYDSLHYLWMGDASINVENQLLHTYDLDVDVLKLGHHGSNTSSSYSFLDNIRPKLGLVSVGYKNRYHHPHSEVIANCHNLGINILMTKDVGMIHIFTWHNYSFFETGNHLFGMLNKSQD